MDVTSKSSQTAHHIFCSAYETLDGALQPSEFCVLGALCPATCVSRRFSFDSTPSGLPVSIDPGNNPNSHEGPLGTRISDGRHVLLEFVIQMSFLFSPFVSRILAVDGLSPSADPEFLKSSRNTLKPDIPFYSPLRLCRLGAPPIKMPRRFRFWVCNNCSSHVSNYGFNMFKHILSIV